MIIGVPEALREQLGPDGARALAELLNEARVAMRGDVIEIAADRFGRRLADELGKLRVEMHSAIGELRGEMHSAIGELRAEVRSGHAVLRAEIADLRAEMHPENGKLRAERGAFEGRITRWMFVFWIGQIGALLGILFAFFRT